MSTTRPPERVYDIADVGAALRAQRERLGLTQATAAGLSGVSTRLWSECETGKRANVSFETMVRMLNTMGMELTVAARQSVEVA